MGSNELEYDTYSTTLRKLLASLSLNCLGYRVKINNNCVAHGRPADQAVPVAPDAGEGVRAWRWKVGRESGTCHFLAVQAPEALLELFPVQ